MEEKAEKRVCADCGCELEDGEGTVVRGGDVVCDECLNDHYRECCDCGELVHEDDCSRDYCGEPLCDRCYDNGYDTCSCCEEVVRERDTYNTEDGNTICESCYDSSYFTCDDCGEIYHDDERVYIDGASYCASCAERYRCDCTVVGDYHAGRRADIYSPLFAPGDVPGKTPTFGVELECDEGSIDTDCFRKWTEDQLIHFESDGSLSGDGVECISQPCSLKRHQTFGWDRICTELLAQGFKSHDTECCGLHVHVGRKALTITDVVKMDVWLNRWLLWRDIARRDSIYAGCYRSYKRIDTGHALEGLSWGRIPAKLEKYHGKSDCLGRYQPLNTATNNNGETVEIRIFRGTLKVESLLGTIEACHALVMFAKATGIAKVYDADLPAKFVGFIAERKADYPHVLPMLKRLAKAEREPAEVMAVINRS